MSVSKFGSVFQKDGKLVNFNSLRGPKGNGFKILSDGNFDIENKTLKNVQNPLDDFDVATKLYVDLMAISLKEEIQSKQEQLSTEFSEKIMQIKKEVEQYIEQFFGLFKESISVSALNKENLQYFDENANMNTTDILQTFNENENLLPPESQFSFSP
jgi:hypothetical protein